MGKSNIVIVGNGSSLLEKEKGDIIDSYQNIVRFNAFEIKNYEQFVGTKSTIWFNVINFNDKNNWRVHHNWDKIYLHSWQWDITKDKLYIDFKNYFDENNLNFSKIIKTCSNTTKELAEYANDLTYKSFSTGLIAIWEMLKIYKSVDVIGFDWWDREDHHYNDKAPRGTLHKPQNEYLILCNLEEQRRLYFI